ncbi:MAG TPA: sialidase family protein [Thermoanaerobaculia bacterium]|nr:sialidase family protein [Thermoanaerobaculia bacterium]
MRAAVACWLLALLGLLGLAPGAAPAHFSSITLLPSTQISTDEPAARHVESWLAVNPRDPRNLIAAAIVYSRYGGVAAYASQDGGKSWLRATHGARTEKYFDGGDPSVAFDAEGNAYLATLWSGVTVWKSSDGGRTWGVPAIVPGPINDRPFIACERSAKPLRGRVYTSARLSINILGSPLSDAIGVAISRDGGATFGFPNLLLPSPEIEGVESASDLLVAPDGRLILPLQTFAVQDRGATASMLQGRYSIVVSRDRGRSFSEPRPVAAFRVHGHGQEWLSTKGIGGGRLAMDTSGGPRRGTLYLAWLDAGDGGRYQVMVAASANGGETWSRPVRVNDNESASNQSNPAIAVNDEGVVGVSWNDRRNDPSESCYQPFFAASLDGGATFLPNVEVAKEPACPNGPNYREGTFDPDNPGHRFLNGGDTQGLVGLPGNAFHFAWIGGPGVLQLWSTVVQLSPPSSRGAAREPGRLRPQPVTVPRRTKGVP